MASMDRKPNIVFVVLDTHRWDRLGCYGYNRGTSPNLDAFAAEATLYTTGVAPAQWTIPSHASMFTGEPPSVHGALQSDDVLSPRFRTLAELLQAAGYRTVGFCNNPLVGILENGLRRGFDAFYNYGGAFPAGPEEGASLDVFGRLASLAGRSLQKIAQPIQNAFARSNSLFQGALDPFWVPLWTWVANFKGNTPRSIRDVSWFARRRLNGRRDQPHFLFVNLMETHLPYTPPKPYLETYAPGALEPGPAREFVRDFNKRAGDWFTPPLEPFTGLEQRALGEMYDAEVAYQDHLLAELLEVLERPPLRDNTLVILVGDHGEMLGEHRLMGHAFGVYEELIHVPLVVRFPGQREGTRVDEPTSATRVFHTSLAAAGLDVIEGVQGERVEVRLRSLPTGDEGGRDRSAVVSEAYAPTFAVGVMEARKEALIEDLRCRDTHRAVYENGHKLISIGGTEDLLFSLRDDPHEMSILNGGDNDALKRHLGQQLKAFIKEATNRRVDDEGQRAANADDAVVQQRLRDLGYLE